MRLEGNELALKESGLLTPGVLERILPCKTAAGRETARSWLAGCTTSASLLRRRAAFIKKLQRCDTIQELKENFEKAASAEAVLEELAQEEESVLSSHADAQIYFQGQLTRPLNLIPYVIALFTALKIYVAPLLALCLPIFLCVMPYVLLTGLMNMPIPWETYKQILFQYILGINPQEPWSLKQVLKLIWGLASFGQGILQPIMTSYHSAKLRDGYMRYAEAIETYTKCVEKSANFLTQYGTRILCLPSIPADPYVRVEWWRREKTVREHYRELLGYYDLVCTLGSDRRWRPVRFTGGESMGLQLRDFHDVLLEEGAAVPSSVLLTGHTLFTGPNRGGKSSALRGVLQAVLCAQSFGASWGSAVKLGSPFRRIYTRLVATDAPGCKSLFESDVAFALDILRTAEKRAPALILIDELFHSTNPRDAESSAAYFLRQLWSRCADGSVVSLISTHMFSLLAHAPAAAVNLLCVDACRRPGETMLKYSYSVKPGVCLESSVAEVWSSFAEKTKPAS
jgi:hypothetical protein